MIGHGGLLRAFSSHNSLWVTPFIPRERPNVEHAIAGYLRLPQPKDGG